MTRPPAFSSNPPVLLRRLTPADGPEMVRVVMESVAHLRPWMAWAADDLTAEQVLANAAASTDAWDRGEDYSYAIVVDTAIVGRCGMIPRIGPGGLELGYWLHPTHTGRGLATLATAALVDAAFTLPHIDHLKIIHDSANTHSRAIPQRLGFHEVARVSPPQEPLTSAENGVDVHWLLTRAQYLAHRTPAG
ncbi:GNAT family N-acetyltransferase [Actinokineospora globicatena]|uniref:Acetyltransferase n=1 Tax=Actinokineospora globicatena TaxID=103729 RepID=A0A9W6QT05_9PSEU|nr:GNAT family N-acetyltransferase [Actinokineospora globicatena]GLW95022.1 putative acetyltransferase [Actinokineospora globicatena]